MRDSHNYFSIAHLFTIGLLLSIGVLAFMVPMSPRITSIVSHYLHHEPETVGFIGVGLMALGTLLTFCLLQIYSGRSLELDTEVYVELGLLRKRVDQAFEELGDYRLIDLAIRPKKKLHFIAEARGFDPKKEEGKLDALDQKLTHILRREMGLAHPFSLTLVERK